MADFVISNLDTQEFTFENISFKKLVSNDSYNMLLKKRWQDEYHATFTAVANNSLVVKPIINNQGLKGVINDICLLLSLAQTRCVYCPEFTINGITEERPPFRGSKKISDKIIPDNQIESYLSTAVQTLRKSRWIEKTGFIPSIYFLMGGKYPELGDVEFILAWIALEILANAFCKERGISTILPSGKFRSVIKPVITRALHDVDEENLPNQQKEVFLRKVPELNQAFVRDKVFTARDAYRWDFITDKLFSDWNELRNHIIHSGTYAGLSQTTLVDLSTRLRTSVQLILIGLLGCSEYVPNLQDLKTQIKGNEV